MSVHDWTSHWFDHPAATSAPDADSPGDASDLAEALAGRDAEVTVLAPRDSHLTAAALPAPMPDLDAVPDNALSEDLAALSRVILGIAADPQTLPESEDEAPAPRGSRIRPGATTDEAPLVAGHVTGGARARREPVEPDEAISFPPPPAFSGGGRRVRRESVERTAATDPAPSYLSLPSPTTSTGGARARRDVPPIVGSLDAEVSDSPRGKHAAAWADEPAADVEGDLAQDIFEVEESLPAAQMSSPVEELPTDPAPLTWQAPAVPFELEPEPAVEVESLRWAEAAELSASLGIDLASPSVEWTEEPPAAELQTEHVAEAPVAESEPAPAAAPEPAPVVSWDTLSNVPAHLTAGSPATPPATRPGQNAASLLRELSFLD